MNRQPLGMLDNIRLSNGSESLVNYYHSLLRTDRDKALEIVNDDNIRFCTLYVLAPELTAKSIWQKINPIYQKVLYAVSELSGNVSQATKGKVHKADGIAAETLRRIIKSGFMDDLPDDRYEQLMERAAAVLVKSFNDTSILQELAEMIFSRNRRGALIHELTWIFFEARSIDSLFLLANRLLSPDSRDMELARKLLCFIPGLTDNALHTGPELYTRALRWLEENRPYLYYTGESLHLCNMPMHYNVSYAARYLCRSVMPDGGEPAAQPGTAEAAALSAFKMLDKDKQRQLADFSQMLRRENLSQWTAWFSLPVDEQAALASQMPGGLT